MKWSRYSIFFESKRNGWLLFNTVSRAFLTVDDKLVDAIKGIMEDPEGFDYSEVPMLYMQLRSMGYLVEDTKDDDFFYVEKMRNLTQLYSDSNLLLTIAPTRACNFDCSYCFEHDRHGKPMSDEVEDKLIRFIKSHRSINNNMHITWYGGEPLLAWNRILSIDKRLNDMNRKHTSGLITNGYLLTEEKVAKLNQLNVVYLQITLDGVKETHDGRRCLVNGDPTYDVILNNIDLVMKSDFKGMLHVRVNVDERNEEEFVQVYKSMRQKYPKDFGKRITVYPGFVKGDDHADSGCFFDAMRQGEFVQRIYEKYGIIPLNVFPKRQSQSCTLTKRKGFVVGPEGELYKCWDDVGIPEKVVGTLDVKANWNMPLIAEGMVACSYLDDPECKECKFFPICNGGCHRIRQKNLHREFQDSPCTYFKYNIENLLELYYEQKLKMVENQKKAQAAKKAEEAKKAGN
ncbi:MAG: radical SAM protein [Anaerovoracaceae bacterium]